jgi:methylated-DNA-[protein]-cysteine S-methyltransferase
MNDKGDIYLKVYKLLQKVPKGKATTYGSIARALGINPRFVGRILSVNVHPSKYPCYKVVRADGSLGGYTVDNKNNKKTLEIKENKLIGDGVSFDRNKVSSECLFAF